MVVNKKITKKAFTLIELLVVILIIALLIDVAAPSFLGQQNKAHDSVAKQYLAISYRDGKQAFIEKEAYPPAGTFNTDIKNNNTMIGVLNQSQPSIYYTDETTGIQKDEPRVIAVSRYNKDVVTYMTSSKSGKIFCLQTVEKETLNKYGDIIQPGVYWSYGHLPKPCGTNSDGTDINTGGGSGSGGSGSGSSSNSGSKPGPTNIDDPTIGISTNIPDSIKEPAQPTQSQYSALTE